MRQNSLPSPPVALALVLGVLFAAGPPGAPAQESAFRGWDQLGDPDEAFLFDPDASDLSAFAIQTSSEVRFHFESAEALMRQGRFQEAAEALQEVLNLFPNHVFQVAQTPSRWVGGAEYARWLLANFPPEGREAYEQWVAPRIEGRARDVAGHHDEEALLGLAQRWSLTRRGQQAMERLGDLALERGRFEVAARWYRRRAGLVALAPPAGGETDADAELARLHFKAAAALLLAGARGDADALLERAPPAEVTVAGVERAAGEALERLAAALAPPPPRRDWPVFGGDARHARLAAFGAALDRVEAQWRVASFSPQEPNPYTSRSVNQMEFPFHAVSDGERVYFSDGLRLEAYSFFSDQAQWSRPGPLGRLGGRDDHWRRFDEFARPRNNRVLGSLARGLAVMPTVASGRVVVPLFDLVPRGKDIQFDRTDIVIPIPVRSLHCFDAGSGEPLWEQRRPEQDDQAFVNRVSVVNAPVVVADRVLAAGYVLEGAINLYALSLSLEDGRLLWRTPIVVGQQELTMFNKNFKEFAPQMPAEHEGSLYLCTNLGLLACLDSLTGDLRWLTQYDTVPIRGSQHYSQHRERQPTWNNDAPVVAGDLVLFTPADSDDLQAVDAATGKVRWRISYEANRAGYRYLLGVDDGVVVLAGQDAIGFFDLATGERLGAFSYPSAGRRGGFPMGRGVLTRGVVHQPLYDGLLALEWRRGVLGVETEARLLAWGQGQPGNLLLLDEYLVTVSPEWLSMYYDGAALLARARERAAAGGAAVADLLLLGDLEFRRQDFDTALAAYRRALAAAAGDAEAERRVRDGLYRCHGERARVAEGEEDAPRLVAELSAAAEYAPDDHAFLAISERLLRLQEGDRDAYLATLERIDRRCRDVEFPFSEHHLFGPMKAGLFTLERRARLALAMERPAEAVDAWQRMLLEHRDEPFERGSAGEHAARQIAQAIESHGREVYHRYEREAAERHTAALSAGDVAAMRQVLAAYPNASGSAGFRLGLGRLLLLRGDVPAVFDALAPLLSGAADGEEHLHALFLVARAAEAAEDGSLARAVWRRLGVAGADVAVLGGEGESYGTLARRELDRLGGRADAPGAGALLASLPRGTPVVVRLGDSERVDQFTQLISIEGERGEALADAALIYQDGRLRLFEGPALRERWSAPVEPMHSYSRSDTMRAFALAGRLLVVRRATVLALDPATGAVLHERELPVAPRLVVLGEGLLHLLWDPKSGGAAVAAIEPASGSFFWRRDFDFDGMDLIAAGGRVLVLGPDGRLEALDGLTGADAFRLSLLEVSPGTEVMAFPEFGLIVAAGLGVENRKALVAHDLEDGRRLWRREDLPNATGRGWLFGHGDALWLFTGAAAGTRRVVAAIELLEPRSGRAAARVDGLQFYEMFEAGPAVVAGQAVLVDADTRKRRRNQTDKLVVVEPRAGRTRMVELEGLGSNHADFMVFATAGGRLAGTIDLRDKYFDPNGGRTVLFRFDPGDGSVEIEPLAGGRDFLPADAAVMESGLLVLKDEELLLYPTARDGGR